MKFKQPFHLLIDGPDKVGKTTVINMLSRKLDLPIIKMPNAKQYITDGNIEDYSKFYNNTLIQFHQFDFIMDRGFPTSKVYSRVFDRDVDLSYIDKIEQILKPLVVILVSGNPKDDTEEIKDIKDMFIPIRDGYMRFAEKNGYVTIDTTGLSPIEVCNSILDLIINYNERQ